MGKEGLERSLIIEQYLVRVDRNDVSMALMQQFQQHASRKDSLVECQIEVPKELRLHLEFIDLLGLCAKGKNLVAEQFSSEILPFKELSEILFNPAQS